MENKTTINERFIKITKEAVGYTEEIKDCKNCIYSFEKSNDTKDWYDLVCKVNTICEFKVLETGNCNMFRSKPKEKIKNGKNS